MSSERAWELLGLAEALAIVAHSGQTRRDTEPYFNHCHRVGVAAFDNTADIHAWIVGYLHDVIEDTAITPHTLREIGFPPEVVYDVATLTRQPDTKYADYIFALVKYGTDIALAVKLADLNDNLRDLEDTDGGLRRRYLTAKELVEDEQQRRNNRRSAALGNPCIHTEKEALVA